MHSHWMLDIIFTLAQVQAMRAIQEQVLLRGQQLGEGYSSQYVASLQLPANQQWPLKLQQLQAAAALVQHSPSRFGHLVQALEACLGGDAASSPECEASGGAVCSGSGPAGNLPGSCPGISAGNGAECSPEGGPGGSGGGIRAPESGPESSPGGAGHRRAGGAEDAAAKAARLCAAVLYSRLVVQVCAGR